MEKINIYVPQEVGQSINEDCRSFEIFKKNGIDINRNRFLSQLICGYYNDYMEDILALHNKLSNELLSSCRPDMISETTTNIINNIILPVVPKRKGKRPTCLSLKPTKATEGILNQIYSSPQANDYVSQFLCRMILSYCKKPVYERERIIFKDNYDLLISACNKHLPVTFKTIWNPEQLHTVIPYELVVGQGEQYYYLLCQENDPYLNNTPQARSYRLCRIHSIVLAPPLTFDPCVQDNLAKMKQLAPQFAINTNETICIRLTERGVRSYNRIYNGRPKYIKIESIENNYNYYFNCSLDQVYLYFRRFENDDAIVLFPESLRQRMIAFHQNVISAYIT